MFARLALLFVVVPLLELVLLVQLGRWVGLLPTVGLVLATGVVGAALARREGLRTLTRVRQEMAAGQVPGTPLMDGLAILVGAAFLLTPGLLTDVAGFLLLVPPTRAWIRGRVRRSLERAVERGDLKVVVVGSPSPFGGGSPARGTSRRVWTRATRSANLAASARCPRLARTCLAAKLLAGPHPRARAPHHATPSKPPSPPPSMDIDFLTRLLDAPGPSGFEVRAARVWRKEAESFADRVDVDVSGNSLAALNPDARPRVMLAGHIDEIGLQATHIDDDGYVYVDGIGGWDPQVLVGQRVTILGKDGDVPGVIGKKAIHLMESEERTKASKIKDLWVDVGASSRSEVGELGVRVGDPMVLSQSMIRLAGDRIASRAIDNRIGAFVVLEALRILADDRPAAGAFAVATSQEEIGYQGGGARPSAFVLEPNVALVVDVTFSTDAPDVPKKELGDHKIGGGPVLSRGSAAHPMVFERLVEVAEAEGIPYTMQASPRATRTDADGIHLTRAGVPTGLVSVPNRYMHSPNEIVSVADLENTARLLAAFIRSVDGDTDFTPR